MKPVGITCKTCKSAIFLNRKQINDRILIKEPLNTQCPYCKRLITIPVARLPDLLKNN